MTDCSGMRTAARALLDLVPGEPRARLRRSLDDPRRRWLEYRPRPRPGVSLAELAPAARKAAHRLLATGLSRHAYAQAMSIIALEEVLDSAEGWRRGRHSGDFWVVVFGEPEQPEWGWRFEGHHLSVSMMIAGDEVHPAPVFFGANPALVRYAGRTVLRPLAVEDQLSRELLAAMDPAARAVAVVADQPPPDIRSGPRPEVGLDDIATGVSGGQLAPAARALLRQLATGYLDRLPAPMARRSPAGSTRPGAPHYYRISGPQLLIEYDDTTEAADHVHTVLRRPGGEFGGDPLAGQPRRRPAAGAAGRQRPAHHQPPSPGLHLWRCNAHRQRCNQQTHTPVPAARPTCPTNV